MPTVLKQEAIKVKIKKWKCHSFDDLLQRQKQCLPYSKTKRNETQRLFTMKFFIVSFGRTKVNKYMSSLRRQLWKTDFDVRYILHFMMKKSKWNGRFDFKQLKGTTASWYVPAVGNTLSQRPLLSQEVAKQHDVTFGEFANARTIFNWSL